MKTYEEGFADGAKAVFDALLGRAAARYHGNTVIQQAIDKENALIEEWAIDALGEVSPESQATWHSIHEAYASGKKAGLAEKCQ